MPPSLLHSSLRVRTPTSRAAVVRDPTRVHVAACSTAYKNAGITLCRRVSGSSQLPRRHNLLPADILLSGNTPRLSNRPTPARSNTQVHNSKRAESPAVAAGAAIAVAVGAYAVRDGPLVEGALLQIGPNEHNLPWKCYTYILCN